MKTTAKFWMLLFVINSFVLMMPQTATAQASINFQVFYDNLSPHGYWVDNSAYGYVWVPNVAPGFTPYGSNGYWVYSNVGWTWVSHYSWGWAPFHYGRWFYDPFYGWLWVPGYEWAPAWVVWRSSPGYYGWAPVGPANYQVTYNQWIFVDHNHFGRTNISNYYVSPSRNTTIIRDSRLVTNVRQDKSSKARYNAGPDRAEVQRLTKRDISPVSLSARSKPGQSVKGSELQVYRPNVVKGNSAPSKVARWKDTKATAQGEVKSSPRKAPKASSVPRKNSSPVTNGTPTHSRSISNQQARERKVQQRSEPQVVKDRPVQARQERPEPQVRQEPRVQSRPQQSEPQRRGNPQVMERSGQQRPNPQMQQDRPVQQNMPRQQPGNGNMRQQQTPMPQQMPQQQLPQHGNGQQRGHQR